jgi:hypothetical protein
MILRMYCTEILPVVLQTIHVYTLDCENIEIIGTECQATITSIAW